MVDLTGRLVAFARMDDAPPLDRRHQPGQRGLGDRAERRTRDLTAATALTAAVGYPLALVPGGVLVPDAAGSPVGAVGVAGSSPETDHAVARTAAALPTPVTS